VCCLTNEPDAAARGAFMTRPGVRLMTIHAAKGLEFSTVFGTAVDQLPSVIKPDEVRNGNLLCVEMMQAIDHLFVT
jgi:superfamily I DNA/RNA helicase